MRQLGGARAAELAAAVYSTGAIGRYTPADCLAIIATYERERRSGEAPSLSAGHQ